MTRDSPIRICIVGPLIGRNPGYITTQGEKLADLFTEAGYLVTEVSSATNRWVRLADIVATLLRNLRKIDLLIVTVYSGPSFVVADVASSLGALAGVPMVLSMHGGGLPDFSDRFPRWTRRVLGRGTLVAQSEFHRRAVRGMGMDASVIPNVIALPCYAHALRTSVRPRLFWMRSFSDDYYPELAVQALRLLADRYEDATLVMAGRDKGLEESVKRLAAELGLADRVRFPGFLDMDGKIREASEADIFINTNRVDNRPVAIVEACAMGLPVVATAVGGIPDLLVHQETGLLVGPGNPRAIADAVETLVENPALAHRLSAAGEGLAAVSDPPAVLAAWESVFNSVLAGD